MANRLKLYEVHSFSTSPNLSQRTIVLVEISRSYDKNNFCLFFRDTMYSLWPRPLQILQPLQLPVIVQGFTQNWTDTLKITGKIIHTSRS